MLQQILYYINTYSDYITIGMAVLFLLALSLFLKVITRLNKVKKQYENLLKGMDDKNLEEILLNNAQKINALEQKYNKNTKEIIEVQEILQICLKNFKLVRYNAFDGVGGGQSFSLALLDDQGTGVIISSIHGREDARTYAKMINEGRSEYHLSEEEKQAINEAMNCPG